MYSFICDVLMSLGGSADQRWNTIIVVFFFFFFCFWLFEIETLYDKVCLLIPALVLFVLLLNSDAVFDGRKKSSASVSWVR